MSFQRTNIAHIAAVRRRLSNERLVAYDYACAGDRERSLRLYEWNTARRAVRTDTVDTALRHAFSHLQPQRRRGIADRVERLHHLRNRIAHHEPIHRRDLVADHEDAIAVLAAICGHTRSWAADLSTVPNVLTRRPRLTG